MPKSNFGASLNRHKILFAAMLNESSSSREYETEKEQKMIHRWRNRLSLLGQKIEFFE